MQQGESGCLEIETRFLQITVHHLPSFNQVDVNGSDSHPLFNYLKESLPLPSDDQHTFVSSSSGITWNPIRRSDIATNFEKFLITPNGKPYRRYSANIQIANLLSDIRLLIEKFDV